MANWRSEEIVNHMGTKFKIELSVSKSCYIINMQID